MKTDIEEIAHIHLLVKSFYDRLNQDKLLAPLFEQINWENHIPAMVAFWNNVIFNDGEYQGNPINTLRDIHKRIHLRPEHFDHWIHVFENTVDELFKGPHALLAKSKARSIAQLMQLKIFSDHIDSGLVF